MTKEEKKECKCYCICHNEFVQKIVIVTIGTFIGALLALTVFTAMHKPPMPCPMAPQMRPPVEFNRHFEGQRPPKLDKQIPPKFDGQKPVKLDKQVPPGFDGQKPPKFDKQMEQKKLEKPVKED